MRPWDMDGLYGVEAKHSRSQATTFLATKRKATHRRGFDLRHLTAVKHSVANYLAALASEAGAAAGAAGAEASALAGSTCTASAPCFSPLMSRLSPPLLMTYKARAAKSTNPTTSFHIIHLQNKEGPPQREGPECSTRVTPGCLQNRSVVCVDVVVFGFFDEQATDHDCDTSDDDGVPQAVVHVAGLRHDGKGHGGEQATKPTIANVIGQ